MQNQLNANAIKTQVKPLENQNVMQNQLNALEALIILKLNALSAEQTKDLAHICYDEEFTQTQGVNEDIAQITKYVMGEYIGNELNEDPEAVATVTMILNHINKPDDIYKLFRLIIIAFD